jgi:hypothetical protein
VVPWLPCDPINFSKDRGVAPKFIGLFVERIHMVLEFKEPSSTNNIIPEVTSELPLASRDLTQASCEAV